MFNTPDSPAKTPGGYTTQGGNFWTLITPEIWKVLHAVLHRSDGIPSERQVTATLPPDSSRRAKVGIGWSY
jgi:hypothetical protein